MRQAAPPRFVVRTTIATLVMVAGVLTAVFVGVVLDVRERVRGAVQDKLESGQRMLTALEARRVAELKSQVKTLAETPTLKAAVDRYRARLGSASVAFRREMLVAIEHEVEQLAEHMASNPDILAVTDSTGEVLAVAGRRSADWPVHARVRTHGSEETPQYVNSASGVFQFASSTLKIRDRELGSLQIAKALDNRYAQELATLSDAATLIASGEKLIATTLPTEIKAALSGPVIRALPDEAIAKLGSSEYAVKLLYRVGDAGVYALDSISASTREPMENALTAVFMIALGAFALAAFASVWLARTISKPIDTLSTSLSAMTSSRDYDHPVAPTGFSREVDTLTEAFNSMMRSVSTAEAETQNAYVGAIRALALALDARDPYTAGHSERVSALSVSIGRQMRLSDADLETLRLGALLHDIGKIGISDAVLRKPGPLTPEEFELIEQHPGVGARILRSVHFLAPHIPIVELHHERPDGQGYPHRLRGDEIPLLAGIVHVADAFDAMTSARAYRPARGSTDALRELWRYAGSQFDAEVVQALAHAMPAVEHAERVSSSDVLRPVASRVGRPKLERVG